MNARLRVTLPTSLIADVDRYVEAGRYLDRSDAIRDAIRHLLDKVTP